MRISRSSMLTTVALPFLLPSFASALSLADFQVLPSTVTSTNCASVYNAPISSCTTDDFQNGAQCSQPCIVALLLKASDIQKACLGAVTGDGTLLAYAFHNELAATVCSNVVGNGASSSPSSAAGTAGSAPTSQSTSTSSTSAPSSTTSSQSTLSDSTSSSSTSSTSSTLSTSTTSSGAPLITHDPAFSPTPGPSGFHTTATLSSDSSTATFVPTHRAYEQNGGSPFQYGNMGSSAHSPSLVWSMTTVLLGILYTLR